MKLKFIPALALFVLAMLPELIAHENIQIEPKTKKYLAILKKKPANNYLFERFYASWQESLSTRQLLDYLQEQYDLSSEDNYLVLKALVYEKGGNIEQALGIYDQLSAKQSKNMDVLYSQALLLIQMRYLDAAIVNLEKISTESKQPKGRINALKLLGECYVKKDNQKQAIDCWQTLEKSYAGDEQVMEELLDYYIEYSMNTRAAKLCKRLIKDTGSHYQKTMLSLKLATIYQLDSKKKDALLIYSGLLDKVAGASWLEKEIVFQIEDIYRTDDDIIGLEKYLHELLIKHPGRPFLKQKYAELIYKHENKEKGLKLFEQLLKVSPGNYDLQELYITYLMEAGKNENALKAINSLINTLPNDPLLYYKKATILVKNKTTPELLKTLEKYISLSASSQSSYLKSVKLIWNSHDKQAAIALFEKLMTAYPEQSDLKCLYADYLCQMGKKQKAIALLTTLGKGCDFSILKTIVRLLHKYDASVVVYKIVESRRNSFKNKLAFYELLVENTMRQSDEEKENALLIKSLIQDMLKMVNIAQKPYNLKRVLNIAVFNCNKLKIVERVIKQLQQAASRSLNEEMLLVRLYNIQDPEKAITYLNKKYADFSTSAALLECCVDFYVQADKPKTAITVLKKLISLNEARKSRYLKQLTNIYVDTGRLHDALTIVREWRHLTPGASSPYIQEADILSALSRSEAVIALLKKAMVRFPGSVAVESQLINAYLVAGYPEKAMAYYWQQIGKSKTLSDKLRYFDALLNSTERYGHRQDVTNKLKLREARNPRGLFPVMALIRFFSKYDRNNEELRYYLNKALSLKKNDISLLHEIADLDERNGFYERALKTLKKAEAFDKTDDTTNRLVNLYLAHGYEKEALDKLTKLYESNSGTTEKQGYETAIQLYTNAFYDEAETFINSMLKLHPKSLRLRVLKSMILEKEKKYREAAAELIGLYDLDKSSFKQPGRPAYRPSIHAISNSKTAKEFSTISQLRHRPWQHRSFDYLMPQRGWHHFGSYRRHSYRNRNISNIALPNSYNNLDIFLIPRLKQLSQKSTDLSIDSLVPMLVEKGVMHPRLKLEVCHNSSMADNYYRELVRKKPYDELCLMLWSSNGLLSDEDKALWWMKLQETADKKPALALQMLVCRRGKIDEKQVPLSAVYGKLFRYACKHPEGMVNFLNALMRSGKQHKGIQTEYAGKVIKKLNKGQLFSKLSERNKYLVFEKLLQYLRQAKEYSQLVHIINLAFNDKQQLRDFITNNCPKHFSGRYYHRSNQQALKLLSFPPVGQDVMSMFFNLLLYLKPMPYHFGNSIFNYNRNYLLLNELTGYRAIGSGFVNLLVKKQSSAEAERQNNYWDAFKELKSPILRLCLADSYKPSAAPAIAAKLAADSDPQNIYYAAAWYSSKGEYQKSLMCLKKCLQRETDKTKTYRINSNIVACCLASAFTGSKPVPPKTVKELNKSLAVVCKRIHFQPHNQKELSNLYDYFKIEPRPAFLKAPKLATAKRRRRHYYSSRRSGSRFYPLPSSGKASFGNKLEAYSRTHEFDKACQLAIQEFKKRTNNLSRLFDATLFTNRLSQLNHGFKRRIGSYLKPTHFLSALKKEVADGTVKDKTQYALACELFDKKDDAIKVYRQILALNPNHKLANIRIALLDELPPEKRYKHLEKAFHKNIKSIYSLLLAPVSNGDETLKYLLEIEPLLSYLVRKHPSPNCGIEQVMWVYEQPINVDKTQLPALKSPGSHLLKPWGKKRYASYVSLCNSFLKNPYLAEQGFLKQFELLKTISNDVLMDEMYKRAKDVIMLVQTERNKISSQNFNRAISSFLINYALKHNQTEDLKTFLAKLTDFPAQKQISENIDKLRVLYECDKNAFLKEAEQMLVPLLKMKTYSTFRETLQQVIYVYKERKLELDLSDIFVVLLKRIDEMDGNIGWHDIRTQLMQWSRYLLNSGRDQQFKQLILTWDRYCFEPFTKIDKLTDKLASNQKFNNDFVKKINLFNGLFPTDIYNLKQYTLFFDVKEQTYLVKLKLNMFHQLHYQHSNQLQNVVVMFVDFLKKISFSDFLSCQTNGRSIFENLVEQVRYNKDKSRILETAFKSDNPLIQLLKDCLRNGISPGEAEKKVIIKQLAKQVPDINTLPLFEKYSLVSLVLQTPPQGQLDVLRYKNTATRRFCQQVNAYIDKQLKEKVANIDKHKYSNRRGGIPDYSGVIQYLMLRNPDEAAKIIPALVKIKFLSNLKNGYLTSPERLVENLLSNYNSDNVNLSFLASSWAICMRLKSSRRLEAIYSQMEEAFKLFVEKLPRNKTKAVSLILQELKSLEMAFHVPNAPILLFVPEMLIRNLGKDMLVSLNQAIANEKKPNPLLALTHAAIDAAENKKRNAYIAILKKFMNNNKIPATLRLRIIREFVSKKQNKEYLKSIALPVLLCIAEHSNGTSERLPAYQISKLCKYIPNHISAPEAQKVLTTMVRNILVNNPDFIEDNNFKFSVLLLSLKIGNDKLLNDILAYRKNALLKLRETYVMLACFNKLDTALVLLKKYWPGITVEGWQHSRSNYGLQENEVIVLTNDQVQDNDLFLLAQLFFATMPRLNREQTIYPKAVCLKKVSNKEGYIAELAAEIIKHKFKNPEVQLKCLLLLNRHRDYVKRVRPLLESYFTSIASMQKILQQNPDMFSAYAAFSQQKINNGNIGFGLKALSLLLQHYLAINKPSYRQQNMINQVISALCNTLSGQRQISSLTEKDYKRLLDQLTEIRQSGKRFSNLNQLLQLEIALRFFFMDDKQFSHWFKTEIASKQKLIENIYDTRTIINVLRQLNKALPNKQKSIYMFFVSDCLKMLGKRSRSRRDFASRTLDVIRRYVKTPEELKSFWYNLIQSPLLSNAKGVRRFNEIVNKHLEKMLKNADSATQEVAEISKLFSNEPMPSMLHVYNAVLKEKVRLKAEQASLSKMDIATLKKNPLYAELRIYLDSSLKSPGADTEKAAFYKNFFMNKKYPVAYRWSIYAANPLYFDNTHLQPVLSDLVASIITDQPDYYASSCNSINNFLIQTAPLKLAGWQKTVQALQLLLSRKYYFKYAENHVNILLAAIELHLLCNNKETAEKIIQDYNDKLVESGDIYLLLFKHNQPLLCADFINKNWQKSVQKLTSDKKYDIKKEPYQAFIKEVALRGAGKGLECFAELLLIELYNELQTKKQTKAPSLKIRHLELYNELQTKKQTKAPSLKTRHLAKKFNSIEFDNKDMKKICLSWLLRDTANMALLKTELKGSYSPENLRILFGDDSNDSNAVEAYRKFMDNLLKSTCFAGYSQKLKQLLALYGNSRKRNYRYTNLLQRLDSDFKRYIDNYTPVAPEESKALFRIADQFLHRSLVSNYSYNTSFQKALFLKFSFDGPEKTKEWLNTLNLKKVTEQLNFYNSLQFLEKIYKKQGAVCYSPMQYTYSGIPEFLSRHNSRLNSYVLQLKRRYKQSVSPGRDPKKQWRDLIQQAQKMPSCNNACFGAFPKFFKAVYQMMRKKHKGKNKLPQLYLDTLAFFIETTPVNTPLTLLDDVLPDRYAFRMSQRNSKGLKNLLTMIQKKNPQFRSHPFCKEVETICQLYSDSDKENESIANLYKRIINNKLLSLETRCDFLGKTINSRRQRQPLFKYLYQDIYNSIVKEVFQNKEQKELDEQANRNLIDKLSPFISFMFGENVNEEQWKTIKAELLATLDGNYNLLLKLRIEAKLFLLKAAVQSGKKSMIDAILYDNRTRAGNYAETYLLLATRPNYHQKCLTLFKQNWQKISNRRYMGVRKYNKRNKYNQRINVDLVTDETAKANLQTVINSITNAEQKLFAQILFFIVDSNGKRRNIIPKLQEFAKQVNQTAFKDKIAGDKCYQLLARYKENLALMNDYLNSRFANEELNTVLNSRSYDETRAYAAFLLIKLMEGDENTLLPIFKELKQVMTESNSNHSRKARDLYQTTVNNLLHIFRSNSNKYMKEQYTKIKQLEPAQLRLCTALLELKNYNSRHNHQREYLNTLTALKYLAAKDDDFSKWLTSLSPKIRKRIYGHNLDQAYQIVALYQSAHPDSGKNWAAMLQSAPFKSFLKSCKNINYENFLKKQMRQGRIPKQ